jgi:aryl-alcohol dehydrogenase-like predicted oxidoreductase
MAEDIKSLRRLGTSDIMISPIGLGCWQFSKGRGLSGSYWAALDDAEIERILAAAVAGGINWFDTAEAYGRGESEKALAKGLMALGRSAGEVVIADKWHPVLRRASSITRTIGERLARLSPFPIDLYQIHNPLSVSSIASQMKAMAGLVEAGKIRAIGVSNFSRKQMEKAHRLLNELGLPLVSNQVRYSLIDRGIETSGVLDSAKDLGVTIIAYSPLAQGILSGPFHDDPELARKHGGFRKFMPAFWPSGLAKSKPVVEALRRIAAAHGATPSQAAINWLIAFHGETVVAIPGASRAGQVEDFAAAASFSLTDLERDELDRVSAPFK